MNLNKLFHKNNHELGDKVLKFAIPTRRDSTQTLDLTPPRGPNFRPETSGLMVIALTTHLYTCTKVHLATWCTLCQCPCSKQQSAHLIWCRAHCTVKCTDHTAEYALYEAENSLSNAVLLNPMLSTVCLTPNYKFHSAGQRTNIIHTCINMESVIVHETS